MDFPQELEQGLCTQRKPFTKMETKLIESTLERFVLSSNLVKKILCVTISHRIKHVHNLASYQTTVHETMSTASRLWS